LSVSPESSKRSHSTHSTSRGRPYASATPARSSGAAAASARSAAQPHVANGGSACTTASGTCAHCAAFSIVAHANRAHHAPPRPSTTDAPAPAPRIWTSRSPKPPTSAACEYGRRARGNGVVGHGTQHASRVTPQPAGARTGG
jgi:hypothetical protein